MDYILLSESLLYIGSVIAAMTSSATVPMQARKESKRASMMLNADFDGTVDEKLATENLPPVVVVDEDGKRFLRARQDIPAGTCFYIEKPIATAVKQSVRATMEHILVGLTHQLHKAAGVKKDPGSDAEESKTVYEWLVKQGFELDESAMADCDMAESKDEKTGETKAVAGPPNYWNRIGYIAHQRALMVSTTMAPNLPVGVALYDKTAWCKNSCSPNTELFFLPDAIVMHIANCDIKAKEDISICRTFSATTLPHGIRQSGDQKNECDCNRCTRYADPKSDVPKNVRMSATVIEKMQKLARLNHARNMISIFLKEFEDRMALLSYRIEAEEQEEAKLKAERPTAARLKKKAQSKAQGKVESGNSGDGGASSMDTTSDDKKTETVEELEERLRRDKGVSNTKAELKEMLSKKPHEWFFEETGVEFLHTIQVYEVLDKCVGQVAAKLRGGMSCQEMDAYLSSLAESESCQFTAAERENKAEAEMSGPNKFVHKYISLQDRKALNIYTSLVMEGGGRDPNHMIPIVDILMRVCDLHGGEPGSKPERPHEIMRSLLNETFAPWYVASLCSAIVTTPSSIKQQHWPTVRKLLDKYIVPNMSKDMEGGCAPFRCMKMTTMVVFAWTLVFCLDTNILRTVKISTEVQEQFKDRMSVLSRFLVPWSKSAFVVAFAATMDLEPSKAEEKAHVESKGQDKDTTKPSLESNGIMNRALMLVKIDCVASPLLAELLPLVLTLWTKVNAGPEHVLKHQQDYLAHLDRVRTEEKLKRMAHESMASMRSKTKEVSQPVKPKTARERLALRVQVKQAQKELEKAAAERKTKPKKPKRKVLAKSIPVADLQVESKADSKTAHMDAAAATISAGGAGGSDLGLGGLAATRSRAVKIATIAESIAGDFLGKLGVGAGTGAGIGAGKAVPMEDLESESASGTLVA